MQKYYTTMDPFIEGLMEITILDFLSLTPIGAYYSVEGLYSYVGHPQGRRRLAKLLDKMVRDGLLEVKTRGELKTFRRKI